MRIVSWNMAYWTPGSYKTIPNRQRQWALLAALAPDVALLQECRPGDLDDHAPRWMAEEFTTVGPIPPRWTACSAVLTRRELDPQPLDPPALPESERRWWEFMSGYVAAAELTRGAERIRVASVHAIAQEVSDPAVTDEDHERVRRTVARRSWRNDLAAAALAPWVTGHQFVVGGDWNTAVLFDQTYPGGAEGGPGAGAEFFEARADQGWRHALRKFSDSEVRTYLKPGSPAYELDHIFTDELLHSRMTGCEVLAGSAVTGLSDHAPLVAEFR